MNARQRLVSLFLGLSLSCAPPKADLEAPASAAPTSRSITADAGPERNPSDLAYELRPLIHGENLEFIVTLRFTGHTSGHTLLVLPSSWAGQERLFEALDELSVTSPGAKMTSAQEPAFRHIDHPPGAPVEVRYRARASAPMDVADEDRPYLPIFTDRYFHFIGATFFVYPNHDENVPLRIGLEWRDLPATWTLSNSFGVGRAHQVIEETIRRFRYAVFTGGDFRTHLVDVRGQPVHVSLRGNWMFEDDELVDGIGRIAEAEREFWNDFNVPFFLVSLIPTGRACCSYGGTALTNSLAMFVSTDKGLDDSMLRLVAHELFHHWNGQQIRVQEPGKAMLWFTEGFTQYYARKLLLRAGLITLEQYVADYNRTLYAYASSPARQAPNARVVEDYWKDPAVGMIPYHRGDILAHNWDAEIRVASEGRVSLDAVMRELLSAAVTQGTPASPHSIQRSMARYLPRGVSSDLETYVERGVTALPRRDALGPCVTLKTRRVPGFELGFELAKSETKRSVARTRKGGRAYRAGVRDGQEVLQMEYRRGDPSVPVHLRIRDANGERTLQYLPRGKLFDVPQYERVAEPHRDDQRCLAWFSEPR
ncbi:hypothetical protein ACMHYB_23350 [Sorangium sp. So ce1128]